MKLISTRERITQVFTTYHVIENPLKNMNLGMKADHIIVTYLERVSEYGRTQWNWKEDENKGGWPCSLCKNTELDPDKLEREFQQMIRDKKLEEIGIN